MVGSFLSINDMVAQARAPLRGTRGGAGKRCCSERRQTLLGGGAGACRGATGACLRLGRMGKRRLGWVAGPDGVRARQASGSIAQRADLRPSASPPKRRTAAVGSRGGPLRCGEGDPALGFAASGWEDEATRRRRWEDGAMGIGGVRAGIPRPACQAGVGDFAWPDRGWESAIRKGKG